MTSISELEMLSTTIAPPPPVLNIKPGMSDSPTRGQNSMDMMAELKKTRENLKARNSIYDARIDKKN